MIAGSEERSLLLLASGDEWTPVSWITAVIYDSGVLPGAMFSRLLREAMETFALYRKPIAVFPV